MQHTNTSSMSGGSTTSLFYRDLGARWLTTRSKKGIRRSNKNRLPLSNSPIYGWWRPAWNLSFEGRVRNVALDNSTGNSTATRQATRQVARQLLDRPRQNTPDSMRRRRQVSSSTARQLDRPHQYIRTRQTSTKPRADTDQLVRAPLLQGEG